MFFFIIIKIGGTLHLFFMRAAFVHRFIRRYRVKKIKFCQSVDFFWYLYKIRGSVKKFKSDVKNWFEFKFYYRTLISNFWISHIPFIFCCKILRCIQISLPEVKPGGENNEKIMTSNSFDFDIEYSQNVAAVMTPWPEYLKAKIIKSYWSYLFYILLIFLYLLFLEMHISPAQISL